MAMATVRAMTTKINMTVVEIMAIAIKMNMEMKFSLKKGGISTHTEVQQYAMWENVRAKHVYHFRRQHFGVNGQYTCCENFF